MQLGCKPLDVVLKVTSRCNLNCTYCYVYNKGDETWRTRPVLMSDAVFAAAVDRIRRHVALTSQKSVTVTFHGGEPLLLGPGRFDRWCTELSAALADLCELRLVVQTNGTLIDPEWCRVLVRHDVSVGVSVDGPPDLHDAQRVDRHGRGSYGDVARGIELLRSTGVDVQVLAVIPLGADGLAVHEHLLGLGASAINYLLPDHTHDTIGPVHRRHGPTPCADFLLPIMDRWMHDYWLGEPRTVMVSLLFNVAVLICGGASQIDLLGNLPLRFVFVETDGAIEGLDVLRACGSAWPSTGLTVDADDFAAIAEGATIHREAMFSGLDRPSGCAACPERSTCSGGYLPHRFSRRTGFDNPSVWCADILALFAHARRLLGVSPAETDRLRATYSHSGPR